MLATHWKGTSELVAPHELSSKFLFRVRGEDRPFALASLDQPAILRQVRGAAHATTIPAPVARDDRVAWRWCSGWKRDAHKTVTADYRATSHPSAELSEHTGADYGRRGLHLRGANKERHAVLATRPWTSALLATQGTACGAANG